MAKLTIEEVKHIAKLAMLDFNEEKLENFSTQLSSILDFVQKLDEVQTERLEPLSNVTRKKNVFREDEVKSSLSVDEALSRASQTHKGYFKVKAIFKE